MYTDTANDYVTQFNKFRKHCLQTGAYIVFCNRIGLMPARFQLSTGLFFFFVSIVPSMYRLVTRFQFHVPGGEFAGQDIHCHAPHKSICGSGRSPVLCWFNFVTCNYECQLRVILIASKRNFMLSLAQILITHSGK